MQDAVAEKLVTIKCDSVSEVEQHEETVLRYLSDLVVKVEMRARKQ